MKKARLALPALAAAVLGGVGLACGWFDADPVAELALEVLQDPASTLAVASVDEGPEIPALRPGELVALPGTGSGLQVVGVAPQGADRDPSQVAVIFDRPMVPLEALAGAVPVSCSPAIDGRMRWAGTSTAVVVPSSGRFPAATHYTCSVPAGTAALDGTTLEQAVTWTFGTETPALDRSWPAAGERAWEVDEPIVLRFNQAVDAAAINPYLELRDDAGNEVQVSARAATGTRPSASTVELQASLQWNTEYALTLRAGLPGAEGPATLVADATLGFHTTPPAGVAEFGPVGDDVSPDSSVRVVFTTEIDGKAAADQVVIKPAPPDGWRPAESYTSRYWYYNPRLLPRTTYTVTVNAGVTDVHGQATDTPVSWTFTTGDAEPLLDAPWSSSDLYPANNPASLPLRFRNVQTVAVAIERLDPLVLLYTPKAWSQRLAPGPKATRVVLEAPPERNVVHRQFVPFDAVLRDGRGILRVTTSSPEIRDWEGRPEERTAILQVTDLGTNLKLTPDGATVWVTRLSDGRPVPDAAVVIARGGKRLWAGATSAEGLAVAQGDFLADDEAEWSGEELLVMVQAGADTTIVGHRMRDGLQAWSAGAWEDFKASGRAVEVEAFTDRGVYRPGDEVHVAVTSRVASLAGLAPTQGRVTWTFADPLGAEVASGSCALTAGGCCSFDLQTPDDATLGDWSVTLSADADDARGYVAVPVRAYRAPAFRVDMSAPARLLAGDRLEARADARYLFGAAMVGARARWSVRRTARTPEFANFTGFNFTALPTEDRWSAPEAVEEPVSSGQGVVDDSGRLAILQALPAAEITRPYTYLVEATVTDADRQQVSGRATVAVDHASVYAGVRPEGWIAEAKKPTKVRVTAVTTEGQLAAGTLVRTTILRRTWDNIRERGVDGSWRWVTNHKDEVITTGSTSAAPESSWSFVPEVGGFYIVRAEATDKRGRNSLAEAGVWVFGGDVSWARDDGHRLELVPDKPRYRPGEQARILVKGPKRGLRALVTVEREGIYTRRVVTLDSTSATLAVPVTDAMAPNAFVSVVAAEGAAPADTPGAGMPAVWYGLLKLEVSPDAQRVEVGLTTDKSAYQPGERVTVKLKASQGGKPLANAHVVLWAVDYGVLSLTAYQTPDLHDRFYEERPVGVVTADNRVSVYDRALRLAKGADVGGGGGLGPAVRSNFVTTPLWEGNLATGPDGLLSHSFTLPDNLTTFRVMAVVDDGKAGFGNAAAELRVNRPLIARPALPRFFREGDRVLAGVVLHNNTPVPIDVQVNAEVWGATLKGAPRSVQVAADAATEVPFAITAFTSAEVRFRFTASGGGHADAVEATVPVATARPSEVVATSGSTTGTATVAVAVPDGASPGVGGLDVELSASSLVGVGPAIDYVLDYPHGCLEQEISRARVALLASQVREQTGIARSASELDAVVSTGLARLPGFRTHEGGYAYWAGGRQPDPLATAYATEFLAEARAAGRAVDDAHLAAAAGVLREVLSGRHLPPWTSEEGARAVRARAALALARAGVPDPAYTNRLLAEAALLPAFSKAQLLETVARNNPRDPRIGSLVRDLEADLHVDATSAALVDRDRSKLVALWWGEDVGTIELVRALGVAQASHPLMERLVAHVVRARQQGRWSNTWATAEGLAALVGYARRTEAGTAGGTATYAGQSLLSLTPSPGGRATGNIPTAGLSSGELNVAAQGGRLYYQSRLSYALPVMPARDEGFTVERKLEVIEGGGQGGRVEPGAIVRVTLRVVTPVDRYHVALVDALPAGFEPVDTSFATEASHAGGGDTGVAGRDTGDRGGVPQWWSAWVFNRRELGDSEVKWYADYMPAGIHAQSYVVRATTPGSYAHPAAVASEMYAPDVYGRTDAGRLVVGQAVSRR